MNQPQEKPDKETLDNWLRDPANYRRKFLGIPVYYNPKDKRILPPSKVRAFGLRSDIPLFGINYWTINFANPYSILAAIGISVAGIVVILGIVIGIAILVSN